MTSLLLILYPLSLLGVVAMAAVDTGVLPRQCEYAVTMEGEGVRYGGAIVLLHIVRFMRASFWCFLGNCICFFLKNVYLPANAAAAAAGSGRSVGVLSLQLLLLSRMSMPAIAAAACCELVFFDMTTVFHLVLCSMVRERIGCLCLTGEGPGGGGDASHLRVEHQERCCRCRATHVRIMMIFFPLCVCGTRHHLSNWY